MHGWYLEGYLKEGDTAYRVLLNRFPALVGRQADLAVTLESTNVSRQHAEFFQRNGQLLLKDLGSKNGTYVNHHRVREHRVLNPGDVLRFADVEFRLRRDATAPWEAGAEATRTSFFDSQTQPDRMPVGAREFEQLLRDRLIRPLFQPIVSARDQRITGLELLGRGSHPRLSELPEPLFRLAEALGRSVELSELIRETGVTAWADSAFCHIPLFMNTHPRELNDPSRVLAQLGVLRDRHPEAPLVLEIHEQAVTDAHALNILNDALQDMDIELAYDDFGAGQARLLELLHVPPYAVKFDIGLIRDLDKLPPHRQEMIGLLVTLIQKGQTRALAEGVSHPGELSVCRQLQFDLIQGFACGRPVPLEELGNSPHW
ncbi:MAG: EAL domain-containing protein [Gammaproteobacteria bacterium]|jgi:EAL domain-containing protein (putative c-di-GMP-specific phosphodiesterase class I)